MTALESGENESRRARTGRMRDTPSRRSGALPPPPALSPSRECKVGNKKGSRSCLAKGSFISL